MTTCVSLVKGPWVSSSVLAFLSTLAPHFFLTHPSSITNIAFCKGMNTELFDCSTIDWGKALPKDGSRKDGGALREGELITWPIALGCE